MTALKKAGFNAQQRVRMLLQQPPTIESTLRVGDWHADSRLCYLAANDLAARGTVKGLSGNQWRMCSELARTTGISSRPMVPNPSDLLHDTDDIRSHMAAALLILISTRRTRQLNAALMSHKPTSRLFSLRPLWSALTMHRYIGSSLVRRPEF